MVKFPKVDKKSWCSRNNESGCKRLQNIYMLNLLNSWFHELKMSLNRQKAPAHWINAPKKADWSSTFESLCWQNRHQVKLNSCWTSLELDERCAVFVFWLHAHTKWIITCTVNYIAEKKTQTVTQYYRGIASTPHLLLKPCPLVNSTEQRKFATRNNCMPVTLQTSPIAFWAEQTKESRLMQPGGAGIMFLQFTVWWPESCCRRVQFSSPGSEKLLTYISFIKRSDPIIKGSPQCPRPQNTCDVLVESVHQIPSSSRLRFI